MDYLCADTCRGIERTGRIVRVLVLSAWYYPARNPRAFRTTELVRELHRRGHHVDLFIPKDAIVDDFGMGNVHKVDVERPLERQLTEPSAHPSLRRVVVSFIRWASRFFLGVGPRDMWYGGHLFWTMCQHRKEMKDYDMEIAISYPFSVLLVSRFIEHFYHTATVRIADCGDPLYRNPSFAKAWYLKWAEKWVLSGYHYISVPFDRAKEAYEGLVPPTKITTIPQGVRLVDIDGALCRPNAVPTFCYAGIFYEHIRNPKFFLDYLLTLDQSFRFVVYCLEDTFSQEMLSSYKKLLGEKLLIKSPIDRESLIHEMAKMDFVINFDNDNATQRPSKLIDYAMSRRPILSFNCQTFRPEVFQAFLKGDYREQYHVDLEQYDIRRVVDQFEALFHEKTKEEVQ